MKIFFKNYYVDLNIIPDILQGYPQKMVDYP